MTTRERMRVLRCWIDAFGPEITLGEAWRLSR